MPYAHSEYLIEPAVLADDLDSKNRRVYDVTVFLSPSRTPGSAPNSGRITYEGGHITRAMFLDQIEAASDIETGLGFSLPPANQLEALFQNVGINGDSRVALYSTGNMMWATRAWWLLHYCGHKHVQVLNGGFAAWKAIGLPVSTDSTIYPTGSFQAREVPERFAHKQTVLDAISHADVSIVNALSPEAHAGASDLPYARKGRIAGSVNIYYNDLLHEGYFKEASELKRVLDAKGLLSAPKVITYCGAGIAATVDAFACLLVGQENVSVYDGSLSEWARDETLPMEVDKS
jgi:thiosulfate/3-mercaptopyruvate sulfurtransferase